MTNVPNLDSMCPDDLWSFWKTHQRGRSYRQMFPDGGKHTKSATSDLACYASNKATAMLCRLSGDITAAMTYERICDRIYAGLPAWARW